MPKDNSYMRRYREGRGSSSGKGNASGSIIPDDQSKTWKVELDYDREWKHIQSLYSETDDGGKAIHYIYSSLSVDYQRRSQARYDYMYDVFSKKENELDDKLKTGKITESTYNKQMTALRSWLGKAEFRRVQIYDKEEKIYKKLTAAYRDKYNDSSVW